MKRIAEGLLCLALALLCAQAGAQGTDAPLSIAAGTDLHVNPAYRTTGIVNPLEPYHLQIVDAFLWDAARSGTDVLLLGDITNQGKLAQHEALLEKLRAAQAAGMTVYVLPAITTSARSIPPASRSCMRILATAARSAGTRPP